MRDHRYCINNQKRKTELYTKHLENMVLNISLYIISYITAGPGLCRLGRELRVLGRAGLGSYIEICTEVDILCIYIYIYIYTHIHIYIYI